MNATVASIRISLILALASLTALATSQVYHISLQKLFRAGLVTTFHADKALVGNDVRADFLTTVPYPTIYFRLPSSTVGPTVGQNWSGYSAFVFTLENTSPFPVAFKLRIDDSLNSTGQTNCQHSWETIDGYSRQDFAFPISIDPSIYGMRALPGVNGATWLQYNRNENGNLNRSRITRFLFFMDNPSAPLSLIISSPRLVSTVIDLTGICDEFGQYNHADWNGKLYETSEFGARNLVEGIELASNPVPPDRNTWGGWLGGPNFGGTGRFRTQMINGKWWLVDPGGSLFFAMGMDTISTGDSTITQDREYMFVDLPPSGDPLAQFYGTHNGKQIYSHYRASLYRKYGANYLAESDRRSLDRLLSWGFNLMGNWSEIRLWTHERIAHVVGVPVERAPGGVDCNRFTVDSARKQAYDVFDPNFDTMVGQQANLIPISALGDPYSLGFYVDNEPTFIGSPNTEEGGRYEIAYGMMRRSTAWPGKFEFISQLKDKYVTIAALNLAWQSSYTSWSVLESAINLSAPSSPGRKLDFQAYILSYARTYFQKCANIVREFDPQALYLGCRFFRTSPEILQAASEYCDVMSFNIYQNNVDPTWLVSHSIYGKPLIVSEFHFGATDAGMFSGGLVKKQSQRERGDALRTYVDSVINHPLFVGCSYHQYQDSPLTGRRYDGENYGIGFVTATDTPYREMIDATRDAFSGVYERRFY